MAAIRRLLTFADLDGRDPGACSISARLVAELADGRHIVLLDDRGWTSSGGVASQTSEESSVPPGSSSGPTSLGGIGHARTWSRATGPRWSTHFKLRASTPPAVRWRHSSTTSRSVTACDGCSSRQTQFETPTPVLLSRRLGCVRCPSCHPKEFCSRMSRPEMRSGGLGAARGWAPWSRMGRDARS